MDDMIELKRRMRAVKAQNFYGSIIRDALCAIDLLQDENIKLRDATVIAERKSIEDAMRNIAAMLHLPGDPQYPGDERHTEKRMLQASGSITVRAWCRSVRLLDDKGAFVKDNHCPVCGDQVQSRMACIMEHFAFYQPGMLRYWRGNIATFGWASGLRGSICLSFPFINILLNWRHRKSRLVIPTPDHD